MKNKNMEHPKANLNMVPYCVMKKPSAPSLIESPMSCMALLPGSLSMIQQRIQKLITMKVRAIIKAVKAIKLEEELDTIPANKPTQINGTKTNPILTGSMLSENI